jgi:hypothetical protein
MDSIITRSGMHLCLRAVCDQVCCLSSMHKAILSVIVLQ